MLNYLTFSGYSRSWWKAKRNEITFSWQKDIKKVLWSQKRSKILVDVVPFYNCKNYFLICIVDYCALVLGLTIKRLKSTSRFYSKVIYTLKVSFESNPLILIPSFFNRWLSKCLNWFANSHTQRKLHDTWYGIIITNFYYT